MSNNNPQSLPRAGQSEIIHLDRVLVRVVYNWTCSDEGEDYCTYDVGLSGVMFMVEIDAHTPQHHVDIYMACGEKISVYNINETLYKLTRGEE